MLGFKRMRIASTQLLSYKIQFMEGITKGLFLFLSSFYSFIISYLNMKRKGKIKNVHISSCSSVLKEFNIHFNYQTCQIQLVIITDTGIMIWKLKNYRNSFYDTCEQTSHGRGRQRRERRMVIISQFLSLQIVGTANFSKQSRLFDTRS